MIRELTTEGSWIFPSYSSDDEFCGTFTYSPTNGGVLRVVGVKKQIKELFKHVMSNSRFQETILGKTPPGYLTLVESNLLGWLREITTDEMIVDLNFHAKKILAGEHFKQQADIKFSKLEVEYTHLDEWALVSGIDFSESIVSNQAECVLKYNFPETKKAKISQFKSVKDLQVSLVPYLKRPLKQIVNKEACIKQTYKVRVESADLLTLETFEEILYLLRNFISLGVCEQVFPLTIEAQSETDPYSKIEIFYQLDHFASNVPDVKSFDALFTLPELNKHFETALNNWFEKAELLEPTCDLYFGVRHNPYIYSIHSFLSLAQALETYHMRFSQRYALDTATSVQLLSTVNRILQDRYDDRWNAKQVPFLRRLVEILYYFINIAGAICGGGPFDFAKKVIDSRNYYTHYDPKRPSLKQRAAQGNDLLIITMRLEMLLDVCLLSELGFAKDAIGKCLIKKRGSLIQSLDTGKLPSSKTPFSRL